MDAFYAAVEVRDNPGLAGKPLIIGALPNERGVVSTCSYEARKYGVRSAMNIKEAYRRCPHGVFMHPNMNKYREASLVVHKIWEDYTDVCEFVSLDEGYLDVTGSAHLFGSARIVAHEIKKRTKESVGLTCSVGFGYSMMSAKLACEENKPDGYFEILSPEDLKKLIIDRSVRTIYGVGIKTAHELERIGVVTVRQLLENEKIVTSLLGNHGRQIVELANGVDHRKVTAYADMKSLGTEQTFQNDVTDFDYLLDVLLLYAERLSFDIRQRGIYAHTVTVKVTYSDMKSITRSKTGGAMNSASAIYDVAEDLFRKVEKRPVRLIGLTLSSFTTTPNLQMSLHDSEDADKKGRLDKNLLRLQQKYGIGIVKTAEVLRAEKIAGMDL